ncbi:hypothetical protein ZOSMA_50G00770 [Zostera marina]|uniref:DUF761 domain-containing protein n=1 Tax=Zostera marina TaxID=29655 RepID=A0A0K9NY47_ZOSMR|nr:hypothetical protein ZOSMA_50G00770 [Zostera marina]
MIYMNKMKVAGVLKRVGTLIAAMVRAKSVNLKTKTNALKTRLVIFRLLRSNTKISQEIHTLVSGRHNKMIILNENKTMSTATAPPASNDEDEVNDGEDFCCTGSVIDMVRSCHEENGKDFRLEDEIDVVADVFIKRFYKHIRIQKQLSIKRYHDMLQRSI